MQNAPIFAFAPIFSIWLDFIDKVLNRALDYDARILHPLMFGPLADKLDKLVYQCLLKILQVPVLDDCELRIIRLSM